MEKRSNPQRWLSEHRFTVHFLAFALMVLSAGLLYFAARQETEGWIYFLLGVFTAGNLLALAVR